MITTGASSLELTFETIISGVVYDPTAIQRVNIEVQENKHNLATLDIAGIPPHVLSDYIDKPIYIKVTVGKVREAYFYGYIVYLEPESKNNLGLVNNSPFQTTRVYCLGASYIMRGKRTSAWSNYTLPQIAKTLAEEHNFSVSVPNDTYPFPRLVQSGKSDWELLVEAANFLGYSVVMRGTHIDIWDPFASVSKAMNNLVPLYAMEGTNGELRATPGQVTKFHGVMGAVTPMANKNPEIIHALTTDDSILSYKKSDTTGFGTEVVSLFEDEIAQNAQSMSMANAVLQGRSRKKLPYTATVDVVGDPAIEAGTVVNVTKFNSALDGLWYVQSARHEFFRGSAMSYLTLAKDSNASSFVSPTYVATPSVVPPAPVMKRGIWMAETEMFNVYS